MLLCLFSLSQCFHARTHPTSLPLHILSTGGLSVLSSYTLCVCGVCVLLCQVIYIFSNAPQTLTQVPHPNSNKHTLEMTTFSIFYTRRIRKNTVLWWCKIVPIHMVLYDEERLWAKCDVLQRGTRKACLLPWMNLYMVWMIHNNVQTHSNTHSVWMRRRRADAEDDGK